MPTARLDGLLVVIEAQCPQGFLLVAVGQKDHCSNVPSKLRIPVAVLGYGKHDIVVTASAGPRKLAATVSIEISRRRPARRFTAPT